MTAHRVEPCPKWIRGYVGDRLVVDSRQAELVWEHQRYPYWYFPDGDVFDAGLPVSRLDALPEYVKVDFEAVDRWYEEDVEVIVHPRDPYRRIDALRSSRHVVVRVGGEIIADTTRPTILFETGVRPRYYLPFDDVRVDLLTSTTTRTGCPYKGIARYWTLESDAARLDDVAWCYDEPLPESAPIGGLLCFYDERVDIEVDGRATG